MAVAGDIVRLGIEQYVVVETPVDGRAMLRRSHDPELAEQVWAAVDKLEVIGHLNADNIEMYGAAGWTETEHGVWEKS